METAKDEEATQRQIAKLVWYVQQYLALGVKLLPVWGIRTTKDGRHVCTCPKGAACDQKPGKHPLSWGPFTGGVHTASDDEAALRAVIEHHPELNLAMAVPSGLLVIDVDPRNGGTESFDDLEARHGKFPDTWDQITGGGGRHLCYRVPGNMRFSGRLGPGIDVKQAGGYIMLEPSRHESGQEYGWEASSNPLDDVPLADAPEWLLRMAERPSISAISTAMAAYYVDEVTMGDLRSALQVIDADDRDTWIRVGLALKTIGDAGLSLWDSWSQTSDKYRAGEIVYRWNGFAPTGGISYKTVFHMAQEAGWKNTASTRSKTASTSAPARMGETFPPMVVDEDGVIQDSEPEPPKRALFVPVGDLIGDLKPVEWMVEGYLEKDALSMLFGPSGVGKSFVVVDIACSVATGTPWHGIPVTQGPVFYVAGEGHNGLARRFAAWQKANGVPLKGAPLYKSQRGISMLDLDSAMGLVNEIDEMIQCGMPPPSLIAIDTLARNMGDGDENSAQDVGKFVKHLDELMRERWRAHIMLVHHSGHEGTRARGSSALRGAMDQEIMVAGQSGHIDLTVTKMKDAEVPAPRSFAIKQIGLGVRDDCDVEITGAYLINGQNPLEYVVGKAQDGTELKALTVAKIMYPAWPGAHVAALELKCSERTISRIMGNMKSAGIVHQCTTPAGGRTWALTDKGLDALSMTGHIILGDSA